MKLIAGMLLAGKVLRGELKVKTTPPPKRAPAPSKRQMAISTPNIQEKEKTLMPENTFQKRFFQEYTILLKETFEHGEGIFLDTGTSLLETLATVSAEEASRPLSAQGATVAAHVDHACLYLSVLKAHIQNKLVGDVDWEEIWRTPRSVTPAEWDELRDNLQTAYRSVVSVMESFDAWDGENELNGALALLAHNAYHLGAIRQILFVVR